MEKDSVAQVIQNLNPFEIRAALFKKGDYEFIVTRNHKGVKQTHEKQRQALKILTGGRYKEFLYGGAAGGAKTWTGCVWILFMAYLFPGTRYYIARNKLTDLVDSVLVTWKRVCTEYGFVEGKDWKWNGQKHFITLSNGSYINFLEVKYQPSDPMFEDLGSTEYTCGWIEEIGEIHPDAATALYTRTGRYMNEEYDIKKMVFYTANPKRNWAKMEFYDPWLAGTLKESRFFMQALVQDNPFIPDDYIESLKETKDRNPAMYKRLYLGDWEYEDNPNQIPDDDMLDAMWDNNHVPHGTYYLTADIARFGSDKAVVGVWSGWRLKKIYTLEISKTTDIELLIRTLRNKHRIPKTHCIADEDGVGGGVVDGAGILGFINGSTPKPESGKKVQYRNLQVQCLYKLAERINDGQIYISADLTNEEKRKIREELTQIEARNNDDRKLDLKRKSEIIESIGRSPDYRDMIMMRVYFDLVKRRKKYFATRKRQVV